MQKIGQITNADLYINGTDVRGRVAEFALDGEGLTEVEHSALGMIGVLKLPGRPLEALTGKLKFEWLDEGVERELLNPVKRHNMQMHSYVDVFDAEGLNPEQSHTLVTHVGFQVIKRSGLTAKLGEGMGSEYQITIPSFSQKVYGEATPIIEIDIFAGIYNVNGAPVWSQ